MDAPPVRYVTTSDGFNIAYCVSGEGMPLLFMPGAFNHVRLAWEYPGLAAWLRGLSDRFNLIQLDPRGFGMSTRDVSENLTRDDYVKDLKAVVNRLGLQRFAIVGISNGSNPAIDFALEEPGRVTGLVLGGIAFRWATALFDVLPSQDWDMFLHSIIPRDRSPEERATLVGLRRQAEDQRNYLLRSRMLYGDADRYAADMEKRLSELQTPTLVLRVRDYALHDPDQYLRVAQLSRGRLVLIDGTDIYGDAAHGIRAIESFLAEVSQKAPGPEKTSGLSQREVEVLGLLAAGKSNAQIAEALVISQNTVIRHVSNIFAKIGTANRAEAAAYATRLGLV